MTGDDGAKRSELLFSDDEAIEARLLAAFPTDRAVWEHSQIFCLNRIRKFSVFFCPRMRDLAQRGKTIERICEKHLPDYVGRRYLNLLSAGHAVTLDKVLEVNRVLEAIALSEDAKVREVTRINQKGKVVPFRLDEDSVVPSHYWVERFILKDFRVHCGLSCAQLGELLFGTSDYAESIIHRLEEGELRKVKAQDKPEDKSLDKEEGKNKSGKRLYDYRVTPFTCDHIYKGLRAIFDSRPDLRHGAFPVLPTQSKLFISSHTAGEGAGRRTIALEITNGNLMAASSESAIRQMTERVARFVANRS